MRRHHKVGKKFKLDLKKFDDSLKSIELDLMREVIKLPNKTHPDAPIGNEKHNKLVGLYGKKPEYDFTPLDH